jgi:hypothetical protein
VLENYCSNFGFPATSPWRALTFGEKVSLSIVAGFFDVARAQQAERMRRVGVLMPFAEGDPERIPNHGCQ